MASDGQRLRGLPGPLPAGETIVWQGSPDLESLVSRTFHLTWFAAYFGVLVGWATLSAAWHDAAFVNVLATAGKFGGLACAALGVIAIYAWLVSRSAVYTITTRRIIVRIGVCLPMTINIPFGLLSGAALQLFKHGDGNIAFEVRPGQRLSYILLWPHVRPWRLARPVPTLLGVRDARGVAAALARAVTAAAAPDVDVRLAPAATVPGITGARPARGAVAA